MTDAKTIPKECPECGADLAPWGATCIADPRIDFDDIDLDVVDREGKVWCEHCAHLLYAPPAIDYRAALKDLICATILYLDPDKEFDRHDLDDAVEIACEIDLRDAQVTP